MLQVSSDPFDISKRLWMWSALPLLQISGESCSQTWTQIPLLCWCVSHYATLYYWKIQCQPAIFTLDIHKTFTSFLQKSHFTSHDEKTQNNIKFHITAALAWAKFLLMKMSDVASLFPSPLSSFCTRLKWADMFVCLCIAHLRKPATAPCLAAEHTLCSGTAWNCGFLFISSPVKCLLKSKATVVKSFGH